MIALAWNLQVFMTAGCVTRAHGVWFAGRWLSCLSPYFVTLYDITYAHIAGFAGRWLSCLSPYLVTLYDITRAHVAGFAGTWLSCFEYIFYYCVSYYSRPCCLACHTRVSWVHAYFLPHVRGVSLAPSWGQASCEIYRFSHIVFRVDLTLREQPKWSVVSP